jgi:hypothetical protein
MQPRHIQAFEISELRQGGLTPGPCGGWAAYSQGEARLAAADHQEGTLCRSSVPTGTSRRSRQAQQG